MSQLDTDTICAVATPAGRSGVGIVRISGPLSRAICNKILGQIPPPRYATFTEFRDGTGAVLDKGIALFFQEPNSFTGEDILELQGHGGTFVLKSLIKTCVDSGARIARPGEFSERSFLNNKMDLLQAEAIADLIDANSEQAASSALRSLSGRFSQYITELMSQITQIRVNVEAAIDFSDEDIDFINDTKVAESLKTVRKTLAKIFKQAQQGAILKEGMRVVIAGKPNAGKSSLLNALSGHDSAIVTNIPGTTRDLLSEQINIDGMPVHVVDTAGLRQSNDVVEQEGIKRAVQAMTQADQILLVVDAAAAQQPVDKLLEELGLTSNKLLATLDNSILLKKLTIVYNKIDLIQTQGNSKKTRKIENTEKSGCLESIEDAGSAGSLGSSGSIVSKHSIPDLPALYLSAKTGTGLNELREHLKHCIGFNSTEEGSFIARGRHLQALEDARQFLVAAQQQLSDNPAPELVAEDLRLAHRALGTITGEFTSDDLLGEIFASFCVGK